MKFSVRILTFLLLCLGLLATTAAPAQAADKKGNYAIWGTGNESCHSYSQARSSEADEPFRFYLMGYLTAFNVHQNDTYSISGDLRLTDVLAWFDDYCDQHAVHGFELALKNFVGEHYEKRLQAMPTPYQR
ncbi:MAG: hypothetical protein WDZ86_07795 [Gammaproteobacteria bacterium]